MAVKKDNRPLNADENVDINAGVITYANEVVAIMAGVAASEVEGIAGMCTSGGLADIIGRNRNITRGVKVEVGTEEASVDLYVIMEYGKPIQKACSEVQENVRKNIESMTGLHVVRVDVHVQGVSFEKENRDAQRNLETGKVPYIAPVTDAVQEAEAPAEAPCDPAPVTEEPVSPDPDAAEAVSAHEAPIEAEFVPEVPEEAGIELDNACASQPDENPVPETVEEAPADEPSVEPSVEAPIEEAEAPVAEADTQVAVADEPPVDSEEPIVVETAQPEAKAEKPAPKRKPAAPRKKKPSDATQE